MQSPAHYGFVAPDAAYDCSQCIRTHGEKKDVRGAPQFPPLLAANEQAWWLFHRFQDQQRAGGFDVLGLDYAILPFAFRLYRVPEDEQRLTFEKVSIINREVNAAHARKREADEQRRKSESMAAQGRHRVDV